MGAKSGDGPGPVGYIELQSCSMHKYLIKMFVIGGATLLSIYNEQCVIVVVNPSPHHSP